MKIWLILSHSKVHKCFLVIFFLVILLTYVSFVFKYHILSHYNISQIKFIYKNACIYRGTNNKPIHIFQLQKLITIYLVYKCCNLFIRCIFRQVVNLNLATNLKNYCFYAMLITWKCMPLWKKLNYNTKNEPPYLATTMLQVCSKVYSIN
jgi:hypothetical protein